MNSGAEQLKRMGRYGETVLIGIVVLIIIMLIIPLSPTILDVLITSNIALSLMILLISMYTKEPLQFSIFPTLLLITTLFRLSLNISATRQILVNANAGEVVNSFGNFVVAGNIVVGLVVFFIIVLVQFVVITSGSSRVAEVAARFTLDAMPGKQMSIDADLNAGLIDENEARTRRRKIEREATFYGAMDGASKFVKGDAIAGIVIVLVNILGGFAVGAFQMGMSLGDSIQTYALLTVGLGLVIQIPALLVSTATGMIVTRAASDSNLGADISQQMLAQPKAIGTGAIVIGAFALVPGLPKLSFIIIASVLGAVALFLRNSSEEAELARRELEEEEAGAAQEGSSDEIEHLLGVDPMELEIGYELIPLVDQSQGSDLLERIVIVRRQAAQDMGFIVPLIRIRDNLSLNPKEYRIKVKGMVVAKGELFADSHLALDSGTGDGILEGVRTHEPAFGLPAVWIDNAQRDAAVAAGFTIVDPTSVLITHLTETIKKYAPELVGRQDTQNLLELIKKDNPVVVNELVPTLLTVGEVQRVLQNLLSERVPISDIVTILEILGDRARVTRDVDILSEFVRQGLARVISMQYANEFSELAVITLDPALEQEISGSIHQIDGQVTMAIDPTLTERIVVSLSQEVEKVANAGYQPVLICSAGIRRFVRHMTEKLIDRLVVMAYEELAPEVVVRKVGTVSVGALV